VSTPIAAGDACIANISPQERRKRLNFGIVTLAVTVGILTILLATGASRWWRLALLPFYMSAATGYFQWSDKT
jgi:hypothetical protein